jgi:hypothetical protein
LSTNSTLMLPPTPTPLTGPPRYDSADGRPATSVTLTVASEWIVTLWSAGAPGVCWLTNEPDAIPEPARL